MPMRWMCIVLIYGYINDELVDCMNEMSQFLMDNQGEKVRLVDRPRPPGHLGVRHHESPAKILRGEAKLAVKAVGKLEDAWWRGAQRLHGESDLGVLHVLVKL